VEVVTRSVEFVKILWHFLNLGVEMFLNFLDELGVHRRNEVDCSSLSTESSSSSNSVDIVLFLERKLVVDNKTNLLNINSSCE
jgi:hypothetical protein